MRLNVLSNLKWDDPQILAAIVAAILAIILPEIRAIVIGIFRFLFRNFFKRQTSAFTWEGEVSHGTDGTYYRVPGGQPDLLVVLVHGVLTNATDGWPLLPELLQKQVAGWTARGPDNQPASDDPRPVRFDLLAFEYPAGFLQRASIGEAARNFGDAFKVGYRDYRDIVIVTHSTGGLVVKQALIADMEAALEALDHDEVTTWSLVRSSIALRTRQVVNFAVPHSGGSFLYSLLLFPLYALLFPVLVVTFPFQLLFIPKKQGFSFGLNKIGWELRHRRFHWKQNALRDMERRYRELAERLDYAVLPRPASVEVSGRSDTVVDRGISALKTNDLTGTNRNRARRTQRNDLALFLRGTHPSVRHAQNPNDTTVLFLGGFLKRYGRPFDTAVAHATVTRALELDRHERLISDEESVTKTFPNRPPRGMQGEVKMLQGDVFNALHEESPRIPAEPPIFVVTGDVGTGKSVALRTFARSLAIQFLNAPEEKSTLPIFFPLHSIKGVDPKCFKSSLLEKWHQFVNDRYLDTVDLPDGWLQVRCQRAPTLVILDSVDEFLLHRHADNRRITPEQFRRGLLDLISDVRGTGRVSFILGIRWGEPILQNLRDDASLILHVRWLSLLEACHHFPRARPIIESVLVGDFQRHFVAKDIEEHEIRACVQAVIGTLLKAESPQPQCLRPALAEEIKLLIERQGELNPDQQALSIVRTPLVLNELQRYSTSVEDLVSGARTIRFPHEILDIAIAANIKKSRLHELDLKGTSLRVDHWKLALSLVAMAYSVRDAPELTSDQVWDAVSESETRWKDHVWPAGTEEDRNLHGTAFAIVRTIETREQLLDKTVFFPLGEHRRFKHREWHDYLLGHYFALAFQTANLGEVIRSSFSTKAHLYGGSILLLRKKFRITLPFAQTVVAQMQKELGQFVLGNLAALVAKSMIPIEGEAVQELFSYERKMPRTGKFVLFCGLGYRVLRGIPDMRRAGRTDASHDILRLLLVRFSQQYIGHLQNGIPHGIDAVLGSVGYCYLKALGEIPAEDGNWPSLTLTATQEEEVIDQLHNEKKNGAFCAESSLHPVYKTCQTAFLTVQTEEFNHLHRGISLVHYLYALSVGFKRHSLISSVREGLIPILKLDSSLALELKRQSEVPEVWKIFLRCRELCEPDLSRSQRSAPNATVQKLAER